MPHERALMVFAKVPQPGRVKTRLTDVFSPEDAASLYAAFLKDALAEYDSVDADVRLYLGPTEARLSEELVPEGIRQFEQKGDGLGQRMQRAFLETFAAGYQQVVIVGTDHPTLPTEHLSLAFEALEEPKQIVLGPSEDGGYYLLGMNAFYGALFANMTYSHADVFQQTVERVGKTDAMLTVLPMWHDVDFPDDVRRLRNDLMSSPVALPQTRATMARLLEQYPTFFAD